MTETLARVAAVQTGKSTVRLSLCIDRDGKREHRSYLILTDILTFIPAVGDMLASSELDELDALQSRTDAFRRALHILSYGDNSQLTLRKKLYAKGVLRENIDFALDRVLKHGYIRETEQIERMAIRLAQSGQGPLKIRSRLLSRGYKLDDISAAVRRLRDSGEIDFEATLTELEQRYPDPEQRVRELKKRGFTR